MKGVVYSMHCAVYGDMCIGETDRPVRARSSEHYCGVMAMDVTTAWGNHYVEDRKSATSPNFAPFYRARIVGRNASLPGRRLMVATEIVWYSAAVNRDCGWRLLD